MSTKIIELDSMIKYTCKEKEKEEKEEKKESRIVNGSISLAMPNERKGINLP